MEELVKEDAAFDLDVSSAQYLQRANVHYRYAQLQKEELHKNEEAF